MSTIERERQADEVLTEREQRARVLEAAALEIEVRGHAKHVQMDAGGRVCLYGALKCARGWDGAGWGGAFSPDWYSFFPGGPRGGFEVAEWNNAPERTADEVTFLMRWRAEEIRDGR